MKKFLTAAKVTLTTSLNAALTFILIIFIAAILIPCFAYDDGKAKYKRIILKGN